MLSSPVIVLCSPRSFSSVAAAMLGQHSSLYAFPKLNLFLADRLSELINWDGQTGPLGGTNLSGLRRAIAQLEYREQSATALASSNEWLSQRHTWSTAEM